MGLQLIFAVETNKKCNSDWIYIKDTIEYFYSYERTKVDDSQKKKEAATFKAKKQINSIDSKKLLMKNYRNNTSNIMNVLDGYSELTRKS